MNWHKAKTILILFLIAVNLSLLTYTIFDSYNQRHAKAQVINNAINILSRNGITVDKQIIDDAENRKSVKEIYAYNIISDYGGFAKLIIGNDAKHEEKNTYTSLLGKITFSGDRFYAKANSNSLLRDVNNSSQNITDIAVKLFTQFGITVDRKDITFTENNSVRTVKISKTINNLPVFDSEITMTLSDLGVTSIEGAWYEQELRETAKTNLRSVWGCLIDYMNKRTSQKPCTVTSIILGYAILDEDTYHASLTLTPVLAIENNLGEVVFIDARENI